MHLLRAHHSPGRHDTVDSDSGVAEAEQHMGLDHPRKIRVWRSSREKMRNQCDRLKVRVLNRRHRRSQLDPSRGLVGRAPHRDYSVQAI